MNSSHNPGRNRPHYAWLIAAAVCCCFGASNGLMYNCRGLFYQPIGQELGFSLSAMTLSNTFYGVASLLLMPLVAKLLPKVDLRIIMSAAVLGMGGMQFLMTNFQHISLFYAASAVQGACSAFLGTLPVSLLVSNWFEKRRGFVMGFAGASAGITGAIMNPVCAFLIENFGWRAGYMAIGAALLLLCLPFTLFVVRFSPQQMGLQPYGALAQPAGQGTRPAAPATGPMLAQVRRLPWFWVYILAVGLSASIGSYAQMLPGYTATLGYSVSFGAQIVSIGMLGNIGSKLVIGFLADKIGLQRASILWLAVTAGGHALLWVGGLPPVLLAASFMGGCAASMPMVLIPLITRHIFGTRDLASIQSYSSMSSSLFGSLAFTIYGVIIEYMGGYPVSIGYCVVVALLVGTALALAFRQGRRLMQSTGPAQPPAAS